MTSKPPPLSLSVLLVTYNHERYIAQAMDGLLGQVFENDIEVVIADDASTDNTLEIIKGYEGRDGRFHFKYLPQQENIGITKNYQRGFKACSSPYVAVLEGDDYWISPHKLQIQKAFLEQHWECDACAANYFVFEQDRNKFNLRTVKGDGYEYLSAKDLIADNMIGNFSTCMYRKSALERLPAGLFELCSYDWIVNICLSRQALIGFFQTPLSVYRLHRLGQWSKHSQNEKIKQQMAVIPAYDELTDYAFHEEFEILTRRLRRAVAKTYSPKIENLMILKEERVAAFVGFVKDCVPPLFLVVVRLLLPVKVRRYLARKILWRFL